MTNIKDNLWIPSEGYKYLSNGVIWTDSIYLGRTGNINDWHDTNEEPSILDDESIIDNQE